jgi:hypothetical protein
VAINFVAVEFLTVISGTFCVSKLVDRQQIMERHIPADLDD